GVLGGRLFLAGDIIHPNLAVPSIGVGGSTFEYCHVVLAGVKIGEAHEHLGPGRVWVSIEVVVFDDCGNHDSVVHNFQQCRYWVVGGLAQHIRWVGRIECLRKGLVRSEERRVGKEGTFRLLRELQSKLGASGISNTTGTSATND